ncbi:MAG TPA: hypothetical protein VM253_02470 [Candidatus Limnocylindrales bacterium]|jgi:hypothetical protein|nr:hypothetical protein [Candidatus Limnocylindrales bacterium]
MISWKMRGAAIVAVVALAVAGCDQQPNDILDDGLDQDQTLPTPADDGMDDMDDMDASPSP